MDEMKEVPVPGDIKFASQVFELAFSPTTNIIASGLISGHVHMHKYSVENNDPLYDLTHHQQSCRALQFSTDGTGLFTAGLDKSLHMIDVSTGQAISSVNHAHSNPINSLIVLNDHLLATGDDNGVVKAWDLRQQSMIMESKKNEDYISDFAFHDASKTLLATSGDGTMSVFSMRKRQFIDRSDTMDEELLSCAIIKGGKKVVCGTQEGVLDIFSWGDWGDISDRFVGHPESVDTVVALSPDIVATGSSDGLIRIVNIQPHQLVGVLGMHMDCPVERIRLSGDETLLASCSHDRTVKFWDVTEVNTPDENQNATDLATAMSTDQSTQMAEDNFFSDL